MTPTTLKNAISILAVLGVLAVSVPANAQTVLEFNSGGGWYPGMVGGQCGEGICVDISVRKAFGSKDQIDVLATYRANNSGSAWCGGSRLTYRYPSNAHYSVRMKSGSQYKWNEIMPIGVNKIFVFVKQDDQCY